MTFAELQKRARDRGHILTESDGMYHLTRKGEGCATLSLSMVAVWLDVIEKDKANDTARKD